MVVQALVPDSIFSYDQLSGLHAHKTPRFAASTTHSSVLQNIAEHDLRWTQSDSVRGGDAGLLGLQTLSQ